MPAVNAHSSYLNCLVCDSCFFPYLRVLHQLLPLQDRPLQLPLLCDGGDVGPLLWMNMLLKPKSHAVLLLLVLVEG
jgi:hypothetical protein